MVKVTLQAVCQCVQHEPQHEPQHHRLAVLAAMIARQDQASREESERAGGRPCFLCPLAVRTYAQGQ